jgi:hypothetical protein
MVEKKVASKAGLMVALKAVLMVEKKVPLKAALMVALMVD